MERREIYYVNMITFRLHYYTQYIAWLLIVKQYIQMVFLKIWDLIWNLPITVSCCWHCWHSSNHAVVPVAWLNRCALGCDDVWYRSLLHTSTELRSSTNPLIIHSSVILCSLRRRYRQNYDGSCGENWSSQVTYKIKAKTRWKQLTNKRTYCHGEMLTSKLANLKFPQITFPLRLIFSLLQNIGLLNISPSRVVFGPHNSDARM